MVGMNGIGNAYGVYKSQNIEQKESEYGRTIGEPKLSDEAAKYYDELKKKFGNYDFILVSKDEKENAKANMSKYANGLKTVVLIDEEKIEKMATDKDFRKKYEDILSGVSAQLQQLKDSMVNANVKGYGLQINDDGSVSFFAVLKKASADQKAIVEKRLEHKKLENKEAQKKAEKKQAQKQAEKKASEDEVISANSVEELIKKLEEYSFNALSNRVITTEEQQIGQNIDFRG